MIKVTCSCGTTLNVKDEYAGKRGKCPKCAQATLIPELEIVDPQIAEEVPLAMPSLADSAAANSFKASPAAQNPVAPASSIANQDFNPYQAPQAPLASVTSSQASMAPSNLYVVKDQVRGATPIVFPPNCIYCAAPIPEEEMKSKTIFYTPVWAMLLGGMLAVMATRKACSIRFGVCAEDRRKRRNKILIWSGIAAAAVLLFVIALVICKAPVSPILAIIAGLTFIAALLGVAIMNSSSLVAKTHDKGVFGIKGSGQPFRDLIHAESQSKGKFF